MSRHLVLAICQELEHLDQIDAMLFADPKLCDDLKSLINIGSSAPRFRKTLKNLEIGLSLAGHKMDTIAPEEAGVRSDSDLVRAIQLLLKVPELAAKTPREVRLKQARENFAGVHDGDKRFRELGDLDLVGVCEFLLTEGRREGILAVLAKLEAIKQPYLAYWVKTLWDGIPDDMVATIIERHRSEASLLLGQGKISEEDWKLIWTATLFVQNVMRGSGPHSFREAVRACTEPLIAQLRAKHEAA